MSRAKIIAAAEKLVEFGLDGTNLKGHEPAFLKRAETAIGFNVRWRVSDEYFVELMVAIVDNDVRLSIMPCVGPIWWRDCLRASTAMHKVADVAQRVEEAIAAA